MKLIVEKRLSGDRYDRLRFVRNNGSCGDTLMPRQGLLPHDLLHYVVESALPLKFGFLSQVARGGDVQFVATMAETSSHPEVAEEAVQVAAAVAGLQNQLCAGRFDPDAFLSDAAMACQARGKRPYDFCGIDLKAVLYDPAMALHERWSSVPYCGTLALDFQPR